MVSCSFMYRSWVWYQTLLVVVEVVLLYFIAVTFRITAESQVTSKSEANDGPQWIVPSLSQETERTTLENYPRSYGNLSSNGHRLFRQSSYRQNRFREWFRHCHSSCRSGPRPDETWHCVLSVWPSRRLPTLPVGELGRRFVDSDRVKGVVRDEQFWSRGELCGRTLSAVSGASAGRAASKGSLPQIQFCRVAELVAWILRLILHRFEVQ